MRIETIHYERKVSDGAYGNRSLAATASVDEGEDITVAMAALILLVRDQLARDEAQEQEEQARQREEEMARYRAEQARRRQDVAVSETDPFAEGAHGDEDDEEGEEEEPQRGRALPF